MNGLSENSFIRSHHLPTTNKKSSIVLFIYRATPFQIFSIRSIEVEKANLSSNNLMTDELRKLIIYPAIFSKSISSEKPIYLESQKAFLRLTRGINTFGRLVARINLPTRRRMKIERVIFTRSAHCKFIFRQDGGLTSAKGWPKNRKKYKGNRTRIISRAHANHRDFHFGVLWKQEFVPFGVLRRINFPGNYVHFSTVNRNSSVSKILYHCSEVVCIWSDWFHKCANLFRIRFI